MDQRLAKLAPADDGFYVLALHAKIELEMRRSLVPEPSWDTSFADLLKLYFAHRKNDGARDPQHRLENALADQHRLGNEVRHGYRELDAEIARLATASYLAFLEFSGHKNHPDALELRRRLEAWDKQAYVVVESKVQSNLMRELAETKAKWQADLARVDELRAREAEAAALARELAAARAQADELQRRAKAKDAQYDEQRRLARAKADEVKRLEAEVERNRGERAKLAELRAYLDKTALLGSFARTRKAFEDQVLRLTPDQQAAVDELRLDREALIRGSAGTGKSLVLLKLLERVLAPPSDELGLGGAASVKLVTYTHSLTKYTEYLAGLLHLPTPPGTVVTADSFLNGLAREVLGTGVTYQWTAEPGVAAAIAASGLEEKAFVRECEHLLWAWDLTWESYRHLDRRGFKVPLNEAARKQVWQAQLDVLAALDARGLAPSSVAATRLVARAADWEHKRLDFVLLDEAQDLAPARLKFFRQAARHAFVLAADDGQILNQHRSPFAEAGLDVRGKRTRVLRANFRNTRSIELAANAFYDGDHQPSTYRDGPAPEFYFSDHTAGALDALVAKLRLFLEEFRYDPENILIIHSGKDSGLTDRLAAEHLLWEAVNSDAFRFDGAGRLRVSTFPSAKGLDSPVVLVLWNRVDRPAAWDPQSFDRLQRNYLYVALTRAMEQANVFVRVDDSSVVRTLRELAGT